ncbi:MAG TPA: hypothetical protein VKB30_03740 [Candidatus Limnocylindrales bacterium]|nr:hypothetical protein [Candidatus Limnocylindrales bacterium]
MPTRPVLILNPRDDTEFMVFAEDLVEEGAVDAPELQGKLRSRYSRAVVRPRDLSSERTAVWYVYREGYWVPSARSEEG